MKNEALSPELLSKMDGYWRAANYLSVGQIYLCSNPLLRRPLALADVKHMLLGHWGTTPGQNFIYVHLNRVIKKYDIDMIYVSGPGHGGPAVVGNTYLEGTYSEIYPNISQDEAGLQKLFKQFSFPGGIPSHASPECPGSIHEGGELGYSLSHSFGAVFDNPDVVVACVIGDGEAETGPLATAWHSNKFLDPMTDGAVSADSAPERLQDQQPQRPRAHRARGVATISPRLRLDALLRRRRSAGGHASTHGCHLGHDHRGHPSNPEQCTQQPRYDSSALADDRTQVPQRLDGAEGRRWASDRRHVPCAPGAALRPVHPSRAPQAAGGLAQELPAGRALRRPGAPQNGAGRTCASRPTSDGRQSPRQRRHAAARPAHAGFPRVCGVGAGTGYARDRGHACARALSARRTDAESSAAKLPDLRPRRDALERPGSPLRGDTPPMGRCHGRERRVSRACRDG